MNPGISARRSLTFAGHMKRTGASMILSRVRLADRSERHQIMRLVGNRSAIIVEVCISCQPVHDVLLENIWNLHKSILSLVVILN